MNVQFLLHSKVKITLVFLGLISLFFKIPIAEGNISDRFYPLKQEITLIEAIQQISDSYNVLFNYDRTIISDIKVQFDPTATDNVDDAISAVLENTDLKYQMFNHRYVVIYKNDEEGIESLKEMIQHFQGIVNKNEAVIKKKPALLSPLQPYDIRRLDTKRLVMNVSGIIIDQGGEPLIGVNVLVKGTNAGTSTDFSGKFTLSDVDENATLFISYIGYQSQEVVLNGRTDIRVVLVSDSKLLDEVVIVGYGTQKKINLTGAVSSVDFDEELGNRPITNASQALGGTVSGLWVSQNSGKPGSDGAQIRVRGWGTLNNSNPLVLIDGIEGDFSQINPNDIKSITVLKDAASSAIYGSKAANGVILVTSKSGSYKDDVQISLNSYLGFQSLGRRYDIVDNSADYMELWNQAITNRGGSGLFPDNLISDFRNGSDPYLYPNTNFFDEVFNSGAMHEHNMSVRGGSDKGRYYISFNYLDQEGMMMNTNSQRYGLSVNLESKINEWLTIGGRINGTHKDSNEPYSLSRILYIFSNGGSPFIAPYTEDGRFGSVQAINNNGNIIVDQRNPLIEAANGQSNANNRFYKMNAYLNLNFTKNLVLKTNFSSQFNSVLVDNYNELLYGYTADGQQNSNLNYNEILGASRSNAETAYNTFFTTLNYENKFNERHDVGLIGGVQLESAKNKTLSARSTNPPIEGLTQVDAGTTDVFGNGNETALRMYSFFGRANYAYDDKYLIELNLRADGSSRFKEGNRWGIFPAFSAGWRLSEEKFVSRLDIFSNLKLRMSWGQLGNQNIGNYWPYLTVISQSNGLSHNFGGQLAPGAGVANLVNEDLSWETTTSLDIGVDFEFFNSPFAVEFDYFQKKTTDILVQLPIPLVLGGIRAPFENEGEMINEGFEVSVSYSKNTSNPNEFGYKIGGNLTYVMNQVTKFRGGDSPDQLYLIRENYSYKTLYGFNALGIYQSNSEAEEHMFANGYTPTAGEIKYEDVNGDGRLDFQDQKNMGNTIPKYTFGFNSSFSYLGFDLSFLLQGIMGASVYTNNAWTKPFGVSGGTITKRWADAWTPENPNSEIPALKINNFWDNQRSSFWVDEISYLKIRNMQLGYAVSNKIIDPVGISKLYLYINSQNLFSFVNKDYEGFDPERNTFNSGENYYPIPRIFSVGLNVNF